jgi:hypothetical protein
LCWMIALMGFVIVGCPFVSVDRKGFSLAWF